MIRTAGFLAEKLRVLGEADAWAARTSADADRTRPEPGSDLRGDDDRAHPYELSHAVWHLLSNAVDHLGCLHAVLGDAKVIYMYAPFTLVRASLENSCGAVWLLEPQHRKERVARCLRLAIADVRNGEQVKQLTGQQGPRTEHARLDEIRYIAKRAGLDAMAIKRPASHSEIVRAVDRSGAPGSTIEVSWKLCSGFAHGDWWTTLSASRRTQIPSAADPAIGTFRIEADVTLLMGVTFRCWMSTSTGSGWESGRCRCGEGGRRRAG